MSESTWLIKIEVETKEDGEYILDHLLTNNPVLEIEMEELEA